MFDQEKAYERIYKSEEMAISIILVENYTHGLGIVQKHQVNGTQYEKWSKVITDLYKCSRQLQLDKGLISDSAVGVSHDSEKVYELVQKAIDIIGEINGYPLRREHNLALLFASYTSHRPWDKAVEASGLIKSKEIFRWRLERYFARKIIEQQSKTPEMIADDNEDLRLIRRLKNSAKRRNLSETGKLSTQNTLQSIKNIDFASFVVRGQFFNCNKNHDIEQITAMVDVMLPTGTIISEKISAGYCKDCNLYFMSNYDYLRLREQGVLLCQLISHDTYKDNWNKKLNGNELKAESILHQSGYNVNSSDNLSDIQRREILRRVLDCGLYSKTSLLNFLDWLISRNEKVVNKDMSVALQKWHQDRIFVAQHNIEEQRTVKVEKLIK